MQYPKKLERIYQKYIIKFMVWTLLVWDFLLYMDLMEGQRKHIQEQRRNKETRMRSVLFIWREKTSILPDPILFWAAVRNLSFCMGLCASHCLPFVLCVLWLLLSYGVLFLVSCASILGLVLPRSRCQVPALPRCKQLGQKGGFIYSCS